MEKTAAAPCTIFEVMTVPPRGLAGPERDIEGEVNEPQGPWEHIWDVHCVWQQKEKGWKCYLHQETEPLKSSQEIALPQLFEYVSVDGARQAAAAVMVVGNSDESQGGVSFVLSHAKEVKTGICVVEGNTLYCKRARGKRAHGKELRVRTPAAPPFTRKLTKPP